MVRTRSNRKNSQIEDPKKEISADEENSIEQVGDEDNGSDGESDNRSGCEVEGSDNEKSENDGSESEDSKDDDSENDDSESETEEPNSQHPTMMSSTRKSLLREKPSTTGKNALTSLIPGYTAPMRLDSSSLDKYRCDIRELGKRAERKDASTKDFCLEATEKKANSLKSQKGFLPKSYTQAYSHFKKGTKRAVDESAGKGWFGMQPTRMTDSLKKDLAMIRNRSYLDPKRFYKSTDKHHSVVQVGTVIEGAAEFYSSRLTKKERRANLTEELMADPATLQYAKGKFQKMAREKAYQAELRKHRPKKRKKFY